MNSTLFDILSEIDLAKARLDAARPLPPQTVASLREKMTLEWTYHSNAIEGNTLTLRETKVVLEGITIGGKSIREHMEANNHRDAIGYVDEVVRSHEPLSEWQIKNIHAIVLKGIDANEAGIYRRENVVISGASTIPPDFWHLNDQMRDLICWHSGANEMHPIARAAQLHTRFVEIHPFIDGNGRTGRLLMNLELIKSGYPPAIIRKEDRLNYYDALDLACTSRDYTDISLLVASAVKRSLDEYLFLISKPPAGYKSTRTRSI